MTNLIMFNSAHGPKGRLQGGFTLVELMIAILISSLVMGAAYTVFSSQQKTYTNQEGVADIQQNLRAGMYFLTREVRLAGYCEDDTDPGADIMLAGQGVFQFTMDINNTSSGAAVDWDNISCDGDVLDPGEDITYQLDPTIDVDQDGMTDDGNPPCDLFRVDNFDGSSETLMNNVEAIGYAYACDSDKDGRPDLTTNSNIDWLVDLDGDGIMDTSLDTDDDGDVDADDIWVEGTKLTDDTISMSDICMVRIWILVRSPFRDSSYTDNNTYIVGASTVVRNDNYRRRLLSASMTCRNKGGY